MIIMTVPQCPQEVCDVLRGLEGEKVVIVLKSGDRELVKVVRVVGEVLIAKFDRKFIFVDCDCICAVIADCLDIIFDKFELQYE